MGTINHVPVRRQTQVFTVLLKRHFCLCNQLRNVKLFGKEISCTLVSQHAFRNCVPFAGTVESVVGVLNVSVLLMDISVFLFLFFSCWCGMILVFKAGVSLRCSTRFLFLCNEEKKILKHLVLSFGRPDWETVRTSQRMWSRIINSRTKGRVDFLSLYSPPLPCFRYRICKFATFLDHVPYQVTECWLGSSKNDEGYIECIIFSQQKNK